jgi:hypothetical protein
MLIDLKLRPVRVGWCIDPHSVEQFTWCVRQSSFLAAGARFPIFSEPSSQHVPFDGRLDCYIALTETIVTYEFLIGKTNDSRLLQPLMMPDWNTFPEQVGHLTRAIEVAPASDQLELIVQWEDNDEFALLWMAVFGQFWSGENWQEIELQVLIDRFPVISQKIGANDEITIDFFEQNTLLETFRLHTISDFDLMRVGQRVCYAFDDFTLNDAICIWNLRSTGLRVIPLHLGNSQRFSGLTEELRQLFEAAPSSNQLPSVVVSSGVDPNLVPPWVRLAYFERLDSIIEREDDFPMFDYAEQVLASRLTTSGEILSFQLPFDDRFFSSPNLDTSLQYCQRQKILCVSSKEQVSEVDDFTLCFPPLDLPTKCEVFLSNSLKSPLVKGEKGGTAILIQEKDQFVRLPLHRKKYIIEQLFKRTGWNVTFSDAGARSTRMIKRLGGLEPCSIFRNPVVREILKSFKDAKVRDLQAIQKRIFDLLSKEKLSYDVRVQRAEMLVGDLISKTILQIGKWLKCDNCLVPAWFALSELDEKIRCRLCGENFPFWGQHKSFDLRRSELFNPNDDQGGGIPVSLTLLGFDEVKQNWQQSISGSGIEIQLQDRKVEIDFVLLIVNDLNQVSIILGEAKGYKPLKSSDLDDLVIARDLLHEQYGVPVYLSFSTFGHLTEEFESSLEKFARENSVILIHGDQLSERFEIVQGEPHYFYESGADILARRTATHFNYVYAERMAEITSLLTAAANFPFAELLDHAADNSV